MLGGENGGVKGCATSVLDLDQEVIEDDSLNGDVALF